MAKPDLKRKTVNGFFWGLLESLLSQGQGIIFGIFLARILSVHEFGLIGTITIFISIAQVFIDIGLSQALIRKQQCTDLDYSTVFWANVLIGTVVYAIIWICAPYIAHFYKNDDLILLTRISGLTLIIGSLTIIQQTILTKEVDFKSLTRISASGTFVSGIISIALAFWGFGVWSLVWRTIINQFFRSFLLWKHNKWIPSIAFNKKTFNELFGFGSNILFISIIASLVKNVYNFLIGKYYSITTLGYYTNADQYSGMPSNTFTSLTNKVGFPILATIQDDNEKVKSACTKLITTIMFITFFIMFGLAAVAHPVFYILFGEKWLPSVPYFQILCIAYAITPMHAINHNIMKIKGRSDLFLKTEIIKYIVFIPIIAIGIIFGLSALIIGIAFFYWISFAINSLYSKKLINYSGMKQFLTFLPVLLICLIPAVIIYSLEPLFHNNYLLLITQSLIYFFTILITLVIAKLPVYYDIKQVVLNKFNFNNFVSNLKKQ
jgi:teichuronic acid exporter